MYFVSAVIRLELKSKRTADFLAALVETDVTVLRNGQWELTSSSELKPGDKIFLEAGVIIPCAVKLAAASDFYISESAITGESDIFEKLTGDVCRAGSMFYGYSNSPCFCNQFFHKG